MTNNILTTDGVQVLLRRGGQPNRTIHKRRVAVYARVSTDLEEQATSLSTQMEAFRAQIAARADWELSEVYCEEGKSGTQADKRPEFQRMIADCKAGKVDYVLTKSISRFARNTVECLEYVRQLKQIGVFVCFDKERIDSANSASEMLLSVLAAVAQEESRSISENTKWGQRKRFQEGKPKWSNTYGFVKDETGEYQIDERQAEVVRQIFDRYVGGESMADIVKRLNSDGAPTYYGSKWWVKSVADVLNNEKYIGDVRMQKTYVADHLTHKKVRNDQTLLPGYYVKGHHAPVVSREKFELARRIAEMKDQHGGFTQYPYRGTLFCPVCGEKMARLILSGHGKAAAWACPNESCEPCAIREKYIDRIVTAAFAERGIHIDKVEYYRLFESIERITFDGWKTGVILWKDGQTSRVDIFYDRVSEIPDTEIKFDGENYYRSGERISGGRHVAASVNGTRDDVINLRRTR